MADLLNVLEHKKNTRVMVDGTVYSIGADGVVKDVADAHAAKLLLNARVWKEYNPKQAVAENRGRMKLLDASGDPVEVEAKPTAPAPAPKDPVVKDDKPGEPMDPVLETYSRSASAEGPPPIPESVEAEPEAEAAPEAEEETEWPDPDESMPMDYLRKMAEAYDVKFTIKLGKKSLVKKINAAMYE